MIINIFLKQIPFPRLEIEDVQINPVHTEYFYITKTQAIDDNFVIKNFISSEDRARIQELVDSSKENDTGYGGDESDSDYEAYEKDHFELALNQMRQNKEFNVGKFYI